MNCSRLLQLVITSVAVLAISCSSDRRGGGSSGGTGPTAKDTGVVGNPDSGVNNNQTDTGIPLGCGANPNMCVPHELVGPSPGCACLGQCEQGWRWDSGTSACVPDNGMGRPDSGTGPFDGGILPAHFDDEQLAHRDEQRWRRLRRGAGQQPHPPLFQHDAHPLARARPLLRRAGAGQG